MPSVNETNQFRRLIGDYGTNAVNDIEIDSYLDAACNELTMDFTDINAISAPVTDFDNIVPQYKPEVILYAAINYWWNRASVFADRLSTTVGQASQNAEVKWEHAIKMIEMLEKRYEEIQALRTDITIGNFSRFSKKTLQRYGGRFEEEILEDA